VRGWRVRCTDVIQVGDCESALDTVYFDCLDQIIDRSGSRNRAAGSCHDLKQLSFWRIRASNMLIVDELGSA
jgi:hypothetical protein